MEASGVVGNSTAFLETGTEYEVAGIPAGLRAGAPKQCYANAAECAVDHGYPYCEGYAWVPTLQMWVHHAWNLTPDGRAFDLTWGEPPGTRNTGRGTRYVGREYSLSEVFAGAAARGCYDSLQPGLLTLLDPREN